MDGLGVKQKVCSSPAAAARSGCFKGEGGCAHLLLLKNSNPEPALGGFHHSVAGYEPPSPTASVYVCWFGIEKGV